MTELVLSQVQVVNMGFLQKVHSVTLRNKVCSSEVCKAVNVESFLWIERSQLCRFGHMPRMSQEGFVRQVLLATPTVWWPT